MSSLQDLLWPCQPVEEGSGQSKSDNERVTTETAVWAKGSNVACYCTCFKTAL